MNADALRSAVSIICTAERSFLQRQYGADGTTPRTYHNGQHADDVTAFVVRAGNQLVHAGRLKPRDVELLKIAAVFHDHEQRLGPGANETASTRAASAAMKRYPHLFSHEDITRVEQAILSTAVEFVDEVPYQQIVSDDPMALALADADLSTLGLDCWLDRSLKLFQERETKEGHWPAHGEPDRKAVAKYLKETANLLRNHEYKLGQSKALQEKLTEHRGELLRIIRHVESGRMTFNDLRSRPLQLSL